MVSTHSWEAFVGKYGVAAIEAAIENLENVGGAGVTVDNTVDPPVAVSSIIAPGATIVGDEADLTGVLQMRLLGPFNVTPATSGFMDPPGFVGPLITTLASGVLFQPFAVEVAAFDETGLVEITTTQPTAPLAQYHVGLYAGNAYDVIQTESDKEYAGVGDVQAAAGRVAGPRWSLTVASTPIHIACYSDATPPSEGSLNVYLLIAEPVV
jgi:hypothetical protein